MLCDAKVKVAACGRRWGKSESTAIDIVLYALECPNTIQIIVAPTADQTNVIVDEVKTRLLAVPGLADCLLVRQSPYPLLRFRDGKGILTATTITARTVGTDGEGLRGRHAHRVIEDEAAYIPDEVEDNVITPLLADYDGDLIKVSTPAGRGHFRNDYQRGTDPLQPRYQSFRFPSSDNPYLSREYLKNEKATKPERSWRVEYLAEFADDEGQVFRGVAEVVDEGRADAEPPQVVPYRPGTITYSLGVDLARVEDFTVLSVMDSNGRQVYFERFNQISWERQCAAIRAVALRYKATVWIDSTGVGDPIFEALRASGLPIEGYQLTNASKEALIDNLAMKIEQKQVRLMDQPTQTGELLSYAYELTESRNIRMNAPKGMHDDTVIALALSAWGLTARRPIRVMKW
jgi:hypothetical protein